MDCPCACPCHMAFQMRPRPTLPRVPRRCAFIALAVIGQAIAQRQEPIMTGLSVAR